MIVFIVASQVFLKSKRDHLTPLFTAFRWTPTTKHLFTRPSLCILGKPSLEHELVRPSNMKEGSRSVDRPEPTGVQEKASRTILGRGEEAMQESIDLRKIIFFFDFKHIFHYVH